MPDLMLFQRALLSPGNGPRARPMHPAWARSLRDQCQDAGIACFFKQRGQWTWEQPPDHPEPQAYVCRQEGAAAQELVEDGEQFGEAGHSGGRQPCLPGGAGDGLDDEGGVAVVDAWQVDYDAGVERDKGNGPGNLVTRAAPRLGR